MQQIPTRNYINAAECRQIPISTNHTKGQKKTKNKKGHNPILWINRKKQSNQIVTANQPNQSKLASYQTQQL